MSTVRKFLGYSWAVLTIPLVLVLFFGLNSWAKLLAQSTGVRVSPWMTGGEIVRTLPHEGYETRIHRPVFDGLLGARAGFRPGGLGRRAARDETARAHRGGD